MVQNLSPLVKGEAPPPATIFISAIQILIMPAVMIPSTFSAEERSQLLRTYKIGELARAFTIFGVDRVVIYFDKDEKVDSRKLGDYIKLVLEYANTPQYLRKRLYPLEKEMRYFGVIPALRAPHHPLKHEKVRYRQGLVLEDGSVDVGLDRPVRVGGKVREGEVVNVDMERLEVVEKPSNGYWGYEVEWNGKGLEEEVKRLRKRYVIVGTSRLGEDVRKVKNRIRNENKDYLLVFGSPFRGLGEMVKENIFDYMVNFVPDQNVKTVRVEEAIFISLGIMNVIL